MHGEAPFVSGNPTQIRRTRKQALTRLPPETHLFRLGDPPGIAGTSPDYNRPAKAVQYVDYSETTLSKLGEIAILSNS